MRPLPVGGRVKFLSPIPVKRLRLSLLLLIGLAVPAAAASNRPEVVFLFQNRKVAVAVPQGLKYSSSKNEQGIISVRLAHPRERISLEVAFMPDSGGRFTTARSRKEFLNETFQDYLSESVEQAMHFEELDPKSGSGTYCVFTDATLVGRSKLPRGEFLHTTTGLKSWPGVVAVFTLFSNDTTSKEYQAAMTMLRESVEEILSPLKP